MKSTLFCLLLFAFLLGFLVYCTFGQTPQMPAYPQRDENRLYAQLGRCQADLGDMQAWAQGWKQMVEDKNAEIAKLKAELAEKSK